MDSKIIGVNRRSYPSDRTLRGYVNVAVVLVAGEIGDYAAYAGDGDAPDEWIARNGDKMRFEEACVHFPGGQLEEARYRA